jgi:hypothetical protein
MKKVSALILFFFLFVFVPKTFASAGSFDASNITFDTHTLTFDLSNLNPAYGNWTVSNIEIYTGTLNDVIYSAR